jgi:AraC family transcriptional activator of pobA
MHPAFPDTMPKDAFLAQEITPSFATPGVNRRASEHLIVFIQQGQGVLHIDDQVFPFAAPQLLLISKGQLYSLQQEKEFPKGIIIAFGDCFWDRTPVSARNCKATLFNNAQTMRSIPLSHKTATDLPELLQTVLTEFKDNSYDNKQDVLAAYLKIMVIKIANLHALLTPQTDNNDYLVYQQFMQLLSVGPDQHKDVHSFAAKMNISDRKLAAVCRQYAGKGAKEIINDHIVAEAKRLLRFTPKNIKEISYSLNFTTPYQFSNFFKKYTTFSPLQFRQQHP